MSENHNYSVPEGFASVPVVGEIAGLLHHAGVSADIVNPALEFAAGGGGDYTHRDQDDTAAAKNELQRVWGDSLDSNVDLLRSYVGNNLPDDVSELLANARGKDGRALMNDPAFVISLVELAKRAPAFVKGKGDESEIAAIDAIMRDDPDRYRADPGLRLRALRLYAKRKG